MKKKIVPIALSLMAFTACNSVPQFKINGNVEGMQTGKVFLIKSANSETDTLAQADITDSKFNMTGSVSGLTAAYLVLEGQKGGALIFIDNFPMTAKLNAAKPYESKIEGTEAQQLYNQYSSITNEIRKQHSALIEEYSQTNDTVKIKNFENDYHKIMRIAEEKEKALTLAHSDSYVTAYMLAGKMASLPLEQIEENYALLGENARSSEPGQKIAQRIEKLKTVSIGKTAPNFQQNTPEGKPLSLHSIKSKVKIIDFWASWCGPCRLENPNIKAIYKDFHSKGLEILSVSLDSDKEAWLKAIKEDQLPWHHVSDLKGWYNEAARLYVVNAVPHLIVVDEDNIIIAKNLRGEELRTKITEILK